MIAVDTNLLVYAHRRDSPFYAVASQLVATLAEGAEVWGIPWPCVHEFLSIVTNPRIYVPSTSLDQAIGQMNEWMRSPTLVLLAESETHWAVLADVLRGGRAAGALVHDAKIAAICLQHGVHEFWSADRDYDRFAKLKVINPLVRDFD